MNKDTKQSDILPFKHGQEGTHFACPEMVEKLGGMVGCCECNGHTCKDTKQSDLVKQLDEMLPEMLPESERRIILFLYGLLAKQRHDLKEQVLEAVGEDQCVGGFEDQRDVYAHIGAEEMRKSIRQRIESVFDK